jgi:hypothetical protein
MGNISQFNWVQSVLDTLLWLNTSHAPRVLAYRTAAVTIDAPKQSVDRPADVSFTYVAAHCASTNGNTPRVAARSGVGCADKAAWNVFKESPSRPV